MYIEKIPANLLPGQRVRIKYDCNGGFKLCGTESTPIYSVAQKNADAHGGKHICRSCQMAANNPANRKEVRDKIEKTNIAKYGTAMPINTPEKIAERVEKMFGTEESTQKIVNKRRETSVKRYGADHIMKTDEGIRRLNEAMQEKYGVDFPLQSEKIQEKMRQTCQERYGVDNPLSLPEVRVKGAITTLEKYGVEHYNQLPEMKDYLRQNCTTWLAESYANPWAKGITRPEEWNQKQSKTMIDLITSGKWAGGRWNQGHITGWISHPAGKCRKTNPYFRSHLELIAHIHLSENQSVEWYDFEPFGIDYVYLGKTHRYVLDFLVKYIGDEKLYFVEVKPGFKRTDEINIAKENRGKELARDEGGVFLVWDEVYLKSLNVDTKEALLRSYVCKNQ